MTAPPQKTGEPRVIVRFDTLQRLTHWSMAVLWGVLIVTAIPLYFGSFFGLVLPRHPVELLHLYCGLALPFLFLLSLVGRWGAPMRRDVRRISVWTDDEVQWLRRRGRSMLRADKFNPGQKLNAIVVGASLVVMLATGVMLRWFQPFSVSTREGATFVHDTVSFLLVILIVGHVVMALTHREALWSMVRGKVSQDWAATSAPAWFDEFAVTQSETDTPVLDDRDTDQVRTTG